MRSGAVALPGGSTACSSPSQPLHRGDRGNAAAPQPLARQEPPMSEGAEGQALPEIRHTSHLRESTVLCSLHRGISHRGLQLAVPAQTSASTRLPWPTKHCDFEVTTIIMGQAQKSSNFPGPQELLPAFCPQAFPAPEASFSPLDTQQLQGELLHSNCFTCATPCPDTEAKAPASPAGPTLGRR